jgi:hypothetical protein
MPVRATEALDVAYGDAAPKRDAPGDLLRRRLWPGVVPRGVLVDLTVNPHAVVVGRTFPRANRRLVAGHEVFTPNGGLRKVSVPFDHHNVIRFGKHGAGPLRALDSSSLAARIKPHRGKLRPPFQF